jgi:type I restriction enzyme S subunit
MTGIRCLPVFPYPTELIECLLSDSMRNDIEMKTDSGTILNALNVRNIPKLRFVKAEPQVLKKFEQIARPIRNQMERNKAEMCNLAEMRDAILPGLISGEIQIKDPTKFVGVEMS